MINDAGKTMQIRSLNDQFRKTLQGGVVLMTRGVLALGADAQTQIQAKVRAFEAFTPDNDPWGEHDFGAFEIELPDGAGRLVRERIYFKIEYYDPTRARHSDDPADPSRTERVMTILLASEY